MWWEKIAKTFWPLYSYFNSKGITLNNFLKSIRLYTSLYHRQSQLHLLQWMNIIFQIPSESASHNDHMFAVCTVHGSHCDAYILIYVYPLCIMLK